MEAPHSNSIIEFSFNDIGEANALGNAFDYLRIRCEAIALVRKLNLLVSSKQWIPPSLHDLVLR